MPNPTIEPTYQDTDEYMSIEGELVTYTSHAVQLCIDGDNKWIPKSAINDLTDVQYDYIGTVIELEVENWFLDQEGII